MSNGAERVLASMRASRGEEITREDFIAFNWAGIDIPEWTTEHEAELPKSLRKMSLFKKQGMDLVYTGPPIKT